MDNRRAPAISVIVPVYKVEKYLERCMNSLLGQSFGDLEIILVDDGSPDSCPELCDAYARSDSRVKVIHKRNGGLGFARNSGLDIARGEYVAFADSDDYVQPDMCDLLLSRARETGADIVYGGIYYDRPDGIKQAADAGERIWRGQEQIKSLLLDFVASAPGRTRDTVMEISVWHALFRRSVIEDNGIRFVSERDFISEDVIFDIDILSKCSVVASIAEPVYHYCVNPESLTKTFREDRFGKVKELYWELRRRLEPLCTQDELELRCSRFLIARARRNAMSVAKQLPNAGFGLTRRRLAVICEDEELTRILRSYPIRSLPLRHFAAAWLMKKRAYLPLTLLLRLKSS